MKLSGNSKKVVPLLLGLITAAVIVLAGAGFYINFKNSQLSVRPSPALPSQESAPVAPQQEVATSLDVENWKEYKDPSKKFMIKFPQSWKITFDQSPRYKDKTDLKFEGPEGWVDIMWADSYGGACADPGYEKMTIKSGEETFCHMSNVTGQGKENNTEYWQLQKQFVKNKPLGIYLNSYSYNKTSNKSFTNKEALLKIIETLNIAP